MNPKNSLGYIWVIFNNHEYSFFLDEFFDDRRNDFFHLETFLFRVDHPSFKVDP